MGMLENILSVKKIPLLEGVDSVVGVKGRFKGEFTSTASLNINGEFEGKIKTNGEILVAPGGRVVGEIEGGTVIVSGRVDGNVIAKEQLEITKTGRINGDLCGGRIVIEEGASYQGRVKVEAAETVEQPVL